MVCLVMSWPYSFSWVDPICCSPARLTSTASNHYIRSVNICWFNAISASKYPPSFFKCETFSFSNSWWCIFSKGTAWNIEITDQMSDANYDSGCSNKAGGPWEHTFFKMGMEFPKILHKIILALFPEIVQINI